MNNIIIVDDHSLFREGIKLLIENEGIGQVIAEAKNGQEFLDLLDIHHPDVVIMDIEMPVMGGLEATRKALKLQPDLKILVLTMQSEKANYSDMINAGALGFVLKTSGKKELEKAFQAISNGESYFSNELLRQIILDNDHSGHPIVKNKQFDVFNFTNRETEILNYLCDGLTISETSSMLNISPKTVETYRSALLKKTGSRNTINLVLFAIKNKMVEI